MTYKIEEFNSSDRIYRSGINDKFLQMEQMFVAPIENGGTGATTINEAMNNLGLELKVELYNNSSGTSGSIIIPATQYGDPKRIAIYYGFSNIRGHCEYKYTPYSYYEGYNYFELSLHYLTSSDNLVVRRKDYYYSTVYDTYNGVTGTYYIFRPKYTQYDNPIPSDFFAADGTTWTSDEEIKIYKIIGYF